MHDHAASLTRQTDEHQERVAELRDLIRVAEAEIAVHEALIRLARNGDLLRRVSTYSDRQSDAALADMEAARRAADLPDGAILDPPRTDDSTGVVSSLLHCADWTVEVGWHPDEGFFARPDTRFLKVRRAVVRTVDTDRRREARALDVEDPREDR